MMQEFDSGPHAGGGSSRQLLEEACTDEGSGWSRRCLHEQLEIIADVKRCNEKKTLNMETHKPVCVAQRV